MVVKIQHRGRAEIAAGNHRLGRALSKRALSLIEELRPWLYHQPQSSSISHPSAQCLICRPPNSVLCLTTGVRGKRLYGRSFRGDVKHDISVLSRILVAADDHCDIHLT